MRLCPLHFGQGADSGPQFVALRKTFWPSLYLASGTSGFMSLSPSCRPRVPRVRVHTVLAVARLSALGRYEPRVEDRAFPINPRLVERHLGRRLAALVGVLRLIAEVARRRG